MIQQKINQMNQMNQMNNNGNQQVNNMGQNPNKFNDNFFFLTNNG